VRLGICTTDALLVWEFFTLATNEKNKTKNDGANASWAREA
jgi:hypothetical protein